ncbi:MAG TPA: hypothetical protein VMT23_02145 [Candidatus Binatia bacterium]|nr:hypothetical protein [Candidatus Binatia bacterium]
MVTVCPTVLAETPFDYEHQINKIVHLGHRLQIDLTDGVFATSRTVSPSEAWWPVGFAADIHLMYQNPMEAINQLLVHQPHMIIIHAEADGDFMKVHKLCRNHQVKLGVALLPQTQPHYIEKELSKLDHVLIFSGDLGSFGGHADLDLLQKVAYLKSKKPRLEVGWDGGINSQNISTLVSGGVDVLNVGGYIQTAKDPHKAYNDLVRITAETGTT